MTGGFRTFVVVNPRSAGGTTEGLWSRIAESIQASLGEFDHALTSTKGEATDLTARALASGYEMVVAVGGDGTVNEVANGFFGSQGELILREAVLGTIPRGTGKDFIRTAGIPPDLEGASRALAGRATRPWDVGRIDAHDGSGNPVHHYFVNESDFGIGGDISRKVNESSKALGGFLSFLWATLQCMVSYNSKTVRIRVDGVEQPEVAIYSVIVAIANYGGGGMRLAPKALPDDGLLDLVNIRAQTYLQILRNLPRLYNGRLMEHPLVSLDRCKVVEAESDEPVRVGVDGESGFWLPVRYEVLPRAIRVKVASRE